MRTSFSFRRGSQRNKTGGMNRFLAFLIALPFLVIDALCFLYMFFYGVNSLNFFLFLFSVCTVGPALGFLIYALRSKATGENGGWMEVSNYANLNDMNRKL